MGSERKQYNIVVLDEDPTYLRMWEKIFHRIEGCNYHLTSEPKAAEKIIESENVDLVISEVVLPTSDGYTIAEKAHQANPKTEVVLTTAYDCDLSRFNLKNPHFSILYKPYNNIQDIQRFIDHLMHHEDVFSDISEDSFSENEDFPSVMEWKL